MKSQATDGVKCCILGREELLGTQHTCTMLASVNLGGKVSDIFRCPLFCLSRFDSVLGRKWYDLILASGVAAGKGGRHRSRKG